MSSRSAALLGVQSPRVQLVPAFKSSDVEDATFLSASYGLIPDPWQELVLTAWLARRADGSWAAGRCGLAVPRQNGKNGIIEIRELFGMVVLGEKFLHTAHEVKTARKAFSRLKWFFGDQANDPGARFPELNALVSEIRSTNGQEAITLKDGGAVEFVARSRGSGRGYTVDVLILDEAQELTDEQLEALLPTISSAPLQNPQTILTGTPPSNPTLGQVFTRSRDAGVEGKARRLAWHEWSISGRVDIFDRQVWADTNPSLGRRLQSTVIEDELPPGMTADGFSRERLGKWLEPGEDAGPFPVGTWLSGVDAGSKIAPESPRVFCVDVSTDRGFAHVGVAGLRADRVPHVEVAASRAGVDWIVPWFTERAAVKPMAVTLQAKGAPVSSLLEELEQVPGLTVIPWGGSDLTNATGQLFDLVKASGLQEQQNCPPVRTGVAHLPQPILDVAAHSAVVKMFDGGGSVWDRRKSPNDISALVAVTGALWALGQKRETRSVYEERGVLAV